jgi:hypothetical protein
MTRTNQWRSLAEHAEDAELDQNLKSQTSPTSKTGIKGDLTRGTKKDKKFKISAFFVALWLRVKIYFWFWVNLT